MAIKDFEENMTVTEFFIVKENKVKEATNGAYLDMLLVDKTGEIAAKCWRCNPEWANLYVRGSLVKVQGKVDAYRGSLQLNINKIRLTTDDDQVKREDYIKTAPYKGVDMYQEIVGIVDSFKNPEIRKLVGASLEDVKEKLLFYPAAKAVHHAYEGGLLYHILTMVKIGEDLLKIYSFLDRDLLLAGIILHDLSKTEEMLADDFGVVDYTVEGNLLGHLVKGVAHLEVLGKELGIDPEVVMVLSHMVLSHHYLPEYGSPKGPMLPEAELLHYIDNIDAKMHVYREIYEGLAPGDLSESIFVLDKRRIYKPTWR